MDLEAKTSVGPFFKSTRAGEKALCPEGPLTGNSETYAVGWTRPQTGVAVDKANAMFSERPVQLSSCCGGLMPGAIMGTAGTSLRVLKERATIPTPL